MESLKNNQNNGSNSKVVSEVDKNEIFNELRAIYPEIKQIFAKSAQDALNTKQKLMEFLEQ